jgi:lysophospholipase L1-like esterase
LGRRAFLQTIGLAAITGTAFWAGRLSGRSGGCYVQLGTSITSGVGTRHGADTPLLVGDRLGIRSVNGACPGSCAGQHKFHDFDPVSLYSLADAISSGDWSSQNKTGDPIRDGAISRLMTTRFDTVTHLGLEYGANDFRYDRPIGLDSDFGKETFKGALNYSIQKLLSAFPRLRIFLITPSWMPTFDDLDSDHNPNKAGSFLKGYVETMIRVAEINHIPCLDMWRNLGVNTTNYKTLTWDGIHPNDLGVSRRAEMIASFINAL